MPVLVFYAIVVSMLALLEPPFLFDSLGSVRLDDIMYAIFVSK
jgi:hypothetical protein